MCVGCRDRYPQIALLRLQCNKKVLMEFLGSGRSFYLCHRCIKEEDKKNLIRKLSAICKKSIKITELESVIDG